MAPGTPAKKRARVLAPREHACLRCVVAMTRTPDHSCVIDKASKSSEKCVSSRDGSKIMIEVPASLRDVAEAVVEASQALTEHRTSPKAKTKSGKANEATVLAAAEESWVSAKNAFEAAYNAYKDTVGTDPLTANMRTLRERCPGVLPGGSDTASTSQGPALSLSQEDIQFVKNARAFLDGKLEKLSAVADQVVVEKDDEVEGNGDDA